MKIDLVFVGGVENAQSGVRDYLVQLGASVQFFRDETQIEQVGVGGPVFFLVPFGSVGDFKALRTKLRRLNGTDSVIAILSSADYHTCAEAFRAGATDVLLSPFTTSELERLVSSLQRKTQLITHPDAILPLETVERKAILAAIYACNGQVSKTSRKLGIGRSTLYRKIEQYGISEFRVRDRE